MRKNEHKWKRSVRPTGIESDSILEPIKKLQDHMVLCVSVNYHFATGGAEEYSSYEI